MCKPTVTMIHDEVGEIIDNYLLHFGIGIFIKKYLKFRYSMHIIKLANREKYIMILLLSKIESTLR